jgi:thioredoxin reductase
VSQAILDVAVVGAGPYGLSVGAYLRHRGIAFRVFGRPMDSWLAHMPTGMMLKSDGFASNIYDPESRFTLKAFCAERGIGYDDKRSPVGLETFTEYGLAFRERMVPELEDKLVTSVERLPNGFLLRLDDGETVEARAVVLAVGITHFAHLPNCLANLPPEFLSHSNRHKDLQSFRGRSVAVIGGGASALDLAGLLHQTGAKVQLISRRKELKFHSGPGKGPRSWWQRIRHPESGLGPGLRSRFYADAPLAFHRLPERLRLKAVRKALGPSGGWVTKDMVIGKVPLLLGWTPESAEIRDGMVHLQLCSSDGSKREIAAEHVIAATGYQVRLDRLGLLSDGIRSAVATINGAPALSSSFESSVPGLYFVGVAAANSFGPVMRFAFGARFAAQRVTGAVLRKLSREKATVSAPRLLAHPK